MYSTLNATKRTALSSGFVMTNGLVFINPIPRDKFECIGGGRVLGVSQPCVIRSPLFELDGMPSTQSGRTNSRFALSRTKNQPSRTTGDAAKPGKTRFVVEWTSKSATLKLRPFRKSRLRDCSLAALNTWQAKRNHLADGDLLRQELFSTPASTSAANFEPSGASANLVRIQVRLRAWFATLRNCPKLCPAGRSSTCAQLWHRQYKVCGPAR